MNITFFRSLKPHFAKHEHAARNATGAARRGVTLMELIIALSISLVIFELIFYVYMMAYRSWDIGLAQGRVEDEARRAVQIVSREVRSARIGSVIAADNALRYRSKTIGKVLYLYSPEKDYSAFLAGQYVPTHMVQLKLLASANVTRENYGTGVIIARDLLPPPVTIFRQADAGTALFVGSQVREYTMTLNTQVYPRSYQ